jgi:hypothetical protein
VPCASAQVLLLSSPGLEELYRCCMLFVDDMAEPRETPEHPLKQLKVRAGLQEARCCYCSCPAPTASLAVWLLHVNVQQHDISELKCSSFYAGGKCSSAMFSLGMSQVTGSC